MKNKNISDRKKSKGNFSFDMFLYECNSFFIL